MSNAQSSDLETLLVRQTGLSVILHGLLDRMVTKGLLDGSDIAAVRHYALDMTIDLQNAAGSQARAAGIRIGEEVEAFLDVIVVGPRANDNEEEQGITPGR